MMEYVVNPLFLFLAVWSASGAGYLAGVLAGLFPVPHALTVGMLLLNVITFSLGYLTWTSFQGLVPRSHDPLRARARPLTTKRMQQALAFTLLMGATALLLTLYQAVAIAAYFQVGFVELLRRPALLRFGWILFLEMAVSETSLMVKLLSLTNGLFTLGFVLLGVFMRLDGTRRKYLYLCGFLLVGLAICLMNLSRYDMTAYVMYLVLAYGVTSSLAGEKKSRCTAWSLAFPALAVVAVFAIVELLLRKSDAYSQPERWRGVLFSLYWSLASPIAALNEFLAGFHGRYDLGPNTFYPFFKWLSQLHLIPKPDMLVYGEYVFVPHPANVYTYLYNFYQDFGILGVAIIPYLLGALLGTIKERARRQLPFLVLYVFLLVPIIISSYTYPLLSTRFYMQISFPFLFFRYELPGQGERGAMHEQQDPCQR